PPHPLAVQYTKKGLSVLLVTYDVICPKTLPVIENKNDKNKIFLSDLMSQCLTNFYYRKMRLQLLLSQLI
ncbi:MAG: hypothetical protein OXD32_02205, partial [Endozoicomonadaceae bacterium]|nr:hypothetical protein [Endozoicomonadaceae bacterium]